MGHMSPCKHLDYRVDQYSGCSLLTLDGFACPVQFWRRHVVPHPEAPRDVQFCGLGRGRISGIFQCYQPGEMPCYEPVTAQGK